ncbi:hypothetical protein VOLCADRAFT_103909 [Volvox carteri f. nagariensis]|uniref:Ubiquinol-cytochrome c chaperone domain-containing protein n=1 Tax=Volvox carteri f. nagariensis TaxID=3068 RepID=D8TQ13_VOLCA|nr:uncharacterized protein VOLCADRAFT_103909 [Volvox carteri f. nagariensis]EFJ50456.1 hypothetical protein VOLCADRAFT_103909 [Volvox carteri f. nagariensis]|eukprot:XP_002948581.1 hypothetical protein VOLCADRAFT_103909 [Volvox carteri f. nagariensis]
MYARLFRKTRAHPHVFALSTSFLVSRVYLCPCLFTRLMFKPNSLGNKTRHSSFDVNYPFLLLSAEYRFCNDQGQCARKDKLHCNVWQLYSFKGGKHIARKRVASELLLSLQSAPVTASASCQASTSGSGYERDVYCSLRALDHRHFHRRLFSSLAGTRAARLREVTEALMLPPTSLHFDRGDVPVPEDLNNPLGRAMLRLMGFESKASKILHAAQRLYEAIAENADTGVMQRAFQTGTTFWATYVLLSLHVWMIIHRLRNCGGPDVRVFRQRLYNQFQANVENRVYSAGVQVGVTKWLKKLEAHFYETGFELDEALKGAPTDPLLLADIFLRRFYGGDEKHRADAELVSRYTMRELQCLALTDDAVVLGGHVRFSGSHLLGPAVQRAGVASPAEDAARDEQLQQQQQDSSRAGESAAGPGSSNGTAAAGGTL